MVGVVPVPADRSLVRRRRTIETSAFVARGIGILCTAGTAAGLFGDGHSRSQVMVCLAAIMLMVPASVLSVLAWRAAARPTYGRFGAGQVTLDTVTVTGTVILFDEVGGVTTWPLLIVPIIAAANHHQLPGALLAWLVTSSAYAGGVLWRLDGADRVPPDLGFAVSINLPIAVAVGAQARAFARQLAELQAARAALGHQAAHDPLTGLPNRSRLEQYAALHEGERLGLLLLDLNDFKQVNDSLGHAAGDELLRIVGQRLRGCVRDGDLAARLGGDEFVVLLPGADAATTQEVAARVRIALTAPVELAGRAVAVRASIGAALRPAGADIGLAALTAEADAAMYAAKTAHRRVSEAA